MFQPGSRKEAVGFSISKFTAKKKSPGNDGDLCQGQVILKTEAASPRLAVEGRDLTVAMPKFYVLTIDELPGGFFCGPVVGHTNPIALLT